MAVQYNYTHAAKRLMSDADTLWSGGTRETAAHLAGLSAECALKSVLIGLGLAAAGPDGQINNTDKKKNEKQRVHINKLFEEFQAQLQGRSGAAYLAMLPTTLPPFHDWLVDHRYVADQQLLPVAFERWMSAARDISKLLTEAERNGEAQ
jgi:hypothetical protein